MEENQFCEDDKKVLEMFKELRTTLNSINSSCIKRKSNTNIIDVLAVLISSTLKNVSTNTAIGKINEFKENVRKEDNCSRFSIQRRLEQFTLEKLNEVYKVVESLDQTHYQRGENQYMPILSVDGTCANFNKKLESAGYGLLPSEGMVSGRITGIYRVDKSDPISVELSSSHNERQGAANFIKSTDKYRNALFVFDRGYFNACAIRKAYAFPHSFSADV